MGPRPLAHHRPCPPRRDGGGPRARRGQLLHPLDGPAPAARLRPLRALHATGKPIALVLLAGSAMSVEWAQAHVPAILVGWYPGQQGGAAVADVLFGDASPAGRLPVTFYKSVEQLPPFADYDMK